MNKKLIFFCPVVSGFLLGIGFVLPVLSFLIWVAFLPLIYFTEKINLQKRQLFGAGFLTGFIYFGLVLIWFFQTLPLDWIGVGNGFIGTIFLILIWLIAVSFFSLFVGLFVIFLCSAQKRGSPRMIFLIPSLWIIFEYLRAFGFSVLVSGDASFFGPHWTLGNLSYLLSQNQFISNFSSIGGIYFVSFLIVLANTTFYALLRTFAYSRFKNLKILGIISLIILISVSYFLKIKSQAFSEKALKIALVQTNFPTFFTISNEEEGRRLEIKKSLIKEASNNFSDIIIFPEDSRFLANIDDDFLDKNFQQKQSLIIDSSRVETPNGIKGIINFYDTKNQIIARQNKLFLSPIGEYLPYIIKIPAIIFNKSWVEKFEKSRGYKNGSEIIHADFLNTKIGGLLCSEILSPDLYRKLANESQVIFNLGSHSFAHGSLILNSQVESMAKFRAIETNRFLIRASNQANSYIIDNKGNSVAKNNAIENSVIYGNVLPKKEKTFYVRFGDWILVLALAFVVLLNIRILLNPRNNTKSST